MYSESRIKALTNGLTIKVVDSSNHMAWIYGVGATVFNYVHRASESSRMTKKSETSYTMNKK